MRRFQALGTLVSACMLLLGSQAIAATVSYADGDLLLGFRSTDGTQDYLVDIGQPAQFVNAAPGSTIHITLASSVDLSAVFGANWFTRIDPNTGSNAVLWAVVGGRLIGAGSDPANVLYTTNPNATPWPRLSNNAQAGTTSLTDAMGTTYDGNQSTANSNVAIIQNAGSSNSYRSFQPGGPNSGGISFQQWNPTDEGTPGMTLGFDRIAPGTGPSQLLGTFSLDKDGSLTFQAVPEPSSLVSLTVGAGLLIAFLGCRRKALKA